MRKRGVSGLRGVELGSNEKNQVGVLHENVVAVVVEALEDCLKHRLTIDSIEGTIERTEGEMQGVRG